MASTFVTERPYRLPQYGKELAELSLTALLSVLLVIALGIANTSGIYAVVVLWVTYAISAGFRKRLQAIRFDGDREELVLYYKAFFSPLYERRLTFTELSFQLLQQRRRLFFQVMVLEIWRGRKEMSQIESGKDGFSEAQLQAIIDCAAELELPTYKSQ